MQSYHHDNNNHAIDTIVFIITIMIIAQPILCCDKNNLNNDKQNHQQLQSSLSLFLLYLASVYLNQHHFLSVTPRLRENEEDDCTKPNFLFISFCKIKKSLVSKYQNKKSVKLEIEIIDKPKIQLSRILNQINI